MSFFSFLITRKFPKKETLYALFSGPLTLTRALLYVVVIAFFVVVYIFLITINNTTLITTPAHGGTLYEGVVGAPLTINPVTASTTTDRSLTRLVYAGLMKEYGDRTLIPEIAETYTISPDERTYTFSLRDNVFFHDMTPITSSDISFTIEKFANPILNKRDASYWNALTVATPNARTVLITLPQPDDSFLKRMTIGILPAAHWQGIPDEAFIDLSLTTPPIGAGAFKVSTITRDETKKVDTIVFSRHRHYPLGAPLLSSFVVKFFANKQLLLNALKEGSVDFTFAITSEDMTPENIPKEMSITSISTNNNVILFRKEGEPSLGNPSLLALINRSIDKEQILATVENGYGIPFEIKKGISAEQDTPIALTEIQASLAKLGYTVTDGVLGKNGAPVAMGIATLNTSRFISAGKALSQQMATLGVLSEVQAFDPGTFQDEITAAGFPLVLSDTVSSLPQEYKNALPLYTIVTLLIANENAHGIAQPALESIDLRYANIPNWYQKTNRVWEWIAPYTQKK